VNEIAFESSSEPPLLEAEDLELTHAERSLSWPGVVSVRAQRLLCVGAAQALLAAAIDRSMVRRGSLKLQGRNPQELLLSGQAGYCPRALPVPPDFRVFDALLGSARLIGLGAADVHHALARAEAEGLARRVVKDLGPLEKRLVGLAHGFTGHPGLVLLEDPFEDLEDDAAELVLSVLSRELEGRSWIVGTRLASPWSRRLAQTAELALSADGGTLLGPISPRELVTKGSWVRFDAVTNSLISLLTERGAEVVRTPSQQVVLVRRLSGLSIADVATQAGAALLELSPLAP
jgi:hypothetical protein